MVIDLHQGSKRHRIIYCICITVAFIFTCFALFSKDWAQIEVDASQGFPDSFGILPGYCESPIMAPENCEAWEKESHHFLTTVAVLVALSAVSELIAWIYNLILILNWGDGYRRLVPAIVLPIFACVSFICGCLIFKRKKGERVRYSDDVTIGLDPIMFGFVAHIANILCILTAFAEARKIKEEARVRKAQISLRQGMEMRRF